MLSCKHQLYATLSHSRVTSDLCKVCEITHLSKLQRSSNARFWSSIYQICAIIFCYVAQLQFLEIRHNNLLIRKANLLKCFLEYRNRI